MTANMTRRSLLGGAAGAAAWPRSGRAQSRTVRLGVLNDLSGPYRDLGGMHSVDAARLAVKDFGPGLECEVIFADHQNKPDLGAAIARQWIDRDGVDAILDVPTSSVALAVNEVCRAKNRAYINNGAGTTDLTGAQCTPVTVRWSNDTYMLARSTGGAMARTGGRTWYFITADYVFGQQMQRDTTGFIAREGGQVLGASAYPPLITTDFSSFLVAAQASGAEVLGLANAGRDTVNCIKQAAEFGLTRRMKVAALLMFINDVHGLGLEAAGGLFLTESFYWDMNDRTRAFTRRFQSFEPGTVPNMSNAGTYAGTLHYLKAVKELGVEQRADGAAVVAQMKRMPAQDDAFGDSVVRADGVALVPSFLFQVKTPEESKAAWDYYKLVETTRAEDAWVPIETGGCPLVRK